jgi:hypothetical protein
MQSEKATRNAKDKNITSKRDQSKKLVQNLAHQHPTIA